jgi:Histidine kinase
MSIAIAPARPIAALMRMAGGVAEAWRAITLEQIGLAALLGLAAFAQVLVRALNQPYPAILVEAVNAQIGAFALLLAVLVADRAVDRGAPRAFAYGMAVLVGTALGMAAMTMHMHLVWDAIDNPSPQQARLIAENPLYVPMRAIGFALEWLMVTGLAVYVYADRREARRMTALLHAAELQRNAQAKRVLESQLQAMQARIEPQFLFNTLAQVKRHYELNPAVGQRVLDELIAYLRAAMPRMRDTSSTLAQEIDLAVAYLNLVRMRLGGRLAFEIEAPDGRSVRMAPMVLLPLIDHALAHGPDSAILRSIRILAEIAADKLRVVIVDSGDGLAPETAGEAVTGIRERLLALYGEGATLELRRGEGASTAAVLEIPYEAIEGIDR